MKKLICVLIAVVLSNCEVRPRTSTAQTSSSYSVEMRNGMEYGVWSGTSNNGYNTNALAVVNLTKEKLEVELLQKQLAK